MDDLNNWLQIKKEINNNLAMPLYREFCKEHGIKFHLGYERYNLSEDQMFRIRQEEMPLHANALSLFNSTLCPYYLHKDKIVSFAFTSWDDISYKVIEKHNFSEIMNKDKKEKLQMETFGYASYVIALISTFSLASFLINNLFINLIILITIGAIPYTLGYVNTKRQKVQFNKKMGDLKNQLKIISEKYSGV